MAFNFIPKIEFTPIGGSPTTILFEFPPEGFDSEGKTIKSVGRRSVAKGGATQFSANYLEEEEDINFEMINDTLRGELETFLQTHALFLREFKYFPHATEPSTEKTVELTERGLTYRPTKMVVGLRYRFLLSWRRVIG